MPKVELPEITITHEDLDVLTRVMREAVAEGRYAVASRLGNELHRARIVPTAHAPEGCLTLHLEGRYLEERSGAVRDVVLVPGRGRASVGLVSVLSRLGTALIGLSEGQAISWLDPRGKPRVIRLLNVSRRAASLTARDNGCGLAQRI
ncbi:MAG: hypothetical protein J0I42_06090 [Bosea sp.]|uniref:hypothetical protein n=1 Tax=Bosea sp. (in: a-proteobacteria) TaxID=1871050 RepID=UPI001AC384A6|nr:hypothetical protein [Bosea sp. (in: a-proteobacteria)]MBN9451505.1 hypothetical protein [Bosea sp. (in: a-proteobacteria)]